MIERFFHFVFRRIGGNNTSGGPVTERRTATRFPVDWQIQVEHSEGSCGVVDFGVLRNISSSGALLSVSVQLATGNQVDVYIKLPLTERKWMKYPAFVVRMEQRITNTAYAVRFVNAQPDFGLPVYLPDSWS